ncbi:glucosyltransferase [Saonia flava]|uniref:Glucosyltransferase n=1 Tax=Saonia flava TaxID=523696 RepID=A0A846R2J7_9FLAO|nr:glycosyltransferase [Saonia flava]NJB72643.1 glucosyltransferase [Saonia flava]
MITVSIIMTTYGHEKYIADAINGVLMQECTFNVELIVADDNSPDKTEDVVKDLIKNHPKKEWVKYTKHKENKGMIPNGIWAYEQTKGEYIALCEGDDYWTDPLKLQKQVDFLNANKEFGLVFTDLDFYHNETNVFLKDVFKSKSMPLYFSFEEHLENAGYLAPCTWLCRKELVSFIDEHYVDGTFPWMLNVMANSKIKFLEDNTTVYRVLRESASKSTSMDKRFNFAHGVFKIQKDFLDEYPQSKELVDKIYRKAYVAIFPMASALGNNSFVEEARQYWKKNRKSLKERLFYKVGFFRISKHLFKILYKGKSILHF